MTWIKQVELDLAASLKKDVPAQEALKALTARTDTHLESYSQACTLEVYMRVQRLPRELRDEIYSYILLDPNSYLKLSKIFQSKPKPGCSRSPCICKYDLPRFVDKAYVGHATALEIVKSFYKISHETHRNQFITPKNDSFFFWDLYQANRSLSHDMFQVGVNPWALLRRLTIYLLLESKARSRIERNMKTLFNIENKKDFKLRIYLAQSRLEITIIEKALEIIRPTMKKLIKAGADAEVWYEFPDWGHDDASSDPGQGQDLRWDEEKAVQWNLQKGLHKPRNKFWKFWQQDFRDYLEEFWIIEDSDIQNRETTPHSEDYAEIDSEEYMEFSSSSD